MDESDSLFIRTLLLLVLMGCSAFFSACEVAFFSLNPLQLAEIKKTRGKAGQLVHRLLSKPRELLVTIYIGNELANIAISALAASIAVGIFGSLGIGIAIGLGTFLLLLFGEILPKTLSLRFAEIYSLAAAYPLKGFATIVRPFQKLLIKIGERLIVKLGLGSDGAGEKETAITEEEFKAIVHMGEGDGGLEAQESKMIHNVIQFGETTVSTVMTPKIEMFTLQIEESLEEILPKIMENFYSRVPIYDTEGETILGILFTKDLNRLKHLSPEKFNLRNILHKALFVPESKKIKELLQEFKKMKRHIAIVLDEYGSVCGLVTLEDILEELVGEIDSEMRNEENPVIRIDATHYRLNATLTIAEFNKHFQTDLPEDKFDTVGGMVFGLLGRVPRSGEAVSHENFKFVVEKMKGARIMKLNLTVLEPPHKKEPVTVKEKSA
ncbi:MAG: hemolysin family protein [Nitrospinales bacterium]